MKIGSREHELVARIWWHFLNMSNELRGSVPPEEAREMIWREFLAFMDDQMPRTQPYQKRPVSPALRQQVFERDEYRCVQCSEWRDLTCDHILPERFGGPATLDNLQTLCRACNSRKGSRI